MIMRGLKLFKQNKTKQKKGSLSQFCILFLIKTSCVCVCINNELSAQCSIWAWLLPFTKRQEPLKKLPGFQRFRDDLAKVSFVTASSRIATKIPGNALRNHRAQLWHCQSGAAALTYGEAAGNKEVGAFNGAPKDFFSRCFIWILVFHFIRYSFFRHTISTRFIPRLP